MIRVFFICLLILSITFNAYAKTGVILQDETGYPTGTATNPLKVNCLSGCGGEGGDSGWTDGGTYVALSTTSDSVGIGTLLPGAGLDLLNTTLKVPVSAAPTIDLSGRAGFDNNFYAAGRGAFLIYDETASTALVGIQATDVCENGQVAKWSTGGLWTCEADNNSAAITAADTQVIYSDGANNPVGDAGLVYNKTTNTLTADIFTTTASNTPQVDFIPTQASDTNYSIGVNADGGNDDDDYFRIVKGTTITASPLFTIKSDGNTGIGTTTPTAKLTVIGTIGATAYTGDGSALTGIGAGGWTDGGTNVYTTSTTDNVGIGTTTPSTTLEIVKQSTKAPLMVSSTAAGDGDYLIINSSGNIGIGTLSVTNKLTIGRTQPSIELQIQNTAQYAEFKATQVAGKYFSMGIDDTAAGDDAFFFTSTGIPLTFQVSGTNVNTAPLIITTAGNIGIGTTNPRGALTVMNGNVGIGTWSPQGKLQITGGGNTGIGTTTAPQALYVVGTVQATTGFISASNVGISTTKPNPTNVQITNGIITTWN